MRPISIIFILFFITSCKTKFNYDFPSQYFPYGIYQHDIEIIPYKKKAIRLKGVNKFDSKGALFIALSHFGTTFFKMNIDFKKEKVTKEFMVELKGMNNQVIEYFLSLVLKLYSPLKWLCEENQCQYHRKNIKFKLFIDKVSNKVHSFWIERKNKFKLKVKITHYEKN